MRMRALRWIILLLAASPLAACGGEAEEAWAEPGLEAAPNFFAMPPLLQEKGDPEKGKELFGRIGCNGCHTVDGVGGSVGPDLSGVGARPSRDTSRWPTSEDYIRASIREPKAFVVSGYTPVMPPPDVLGLTEQDVDHLVAYLKTLRASK